jgi:hypothetical protein
MPQLAPVHKVTILPRGRSLGHTLVLPTEDKYTQTRGEMIDTLAYALGGRAAEELVFHEPTTGAGNDIEKATTIARAMITQYGMSAKLGAIKYGTAEAEPFLGRTYGHQRDYSESIAADIDAEVRALIETAHDEAWEILVEYRDVLDSIVLELIEKETISQADMTRLCARVQKRRPMAPFNGFGKRTPSDRPPVMTPSERAGSRPRPRRTAWRAHALTTQRRRFFHWKPAPPTSGRGRPIARGLRPRGPAARPGRHPLSADGTTAVDARPTEPDDGELDIPRRPPGQCRLGGRPRRAGRRPGAHI